MDNLFSDGLRAFLSFQEDAMTLELWLVRHGKTVFNTLGRLQGWSDSPLTPEGCAAAADLGMRLAASGVRFDAAFASTAPRAVKTARLRGRVEKQKTVCAAYGRLKSLRVRIALPLGQQRVKRAHIFPLKAAEAALAQAV